MRYNNNVKILLGGALNGKRGLFFYPGNLVIYNIQSDLVYVL